MNLREVEMSKRFEKMYWTYPQRYKSQRRNSARVFHLGLTELWRQTTILSWNVGHYPASYPSSTNFSSKPLRRPETPFRSVV